MSALNGRVGMVVYKKDNISVGVSFDAYQDVMKLDRPYKVKQLIQFAYGPESMHLLSEIQEII